VQTSAFCKPTDGLSHYNRWQIEQQQAYIETLLLHLPQLITAQPICFQWHTQKFQADILMPFCKITLHINGCAFKSKYIPMKWNISLKQEKENTNGIVTCSKTAIIQNRWH
jgi:hypothetical protein